MGLREKWRAWNYKRYEKRVQSTDDFAEFEQFATGPWTPDIAARMPWGVLTRGPQLGGIDAETKRVIEIEIERRHRSGHPALANLLSFGALVVAVIALCRS